MSKATVNRPQGSVAVEAADILADLREMFHAARRRVATVANAEQTLLYWRLGKRIRTEVLGGDRAAYGGQIVVSVSRQLEAEFGKGFGEKMFGVWFSSQRCSLTRKLLYRCYNNSADFKIGTHCVPNLHPSSKAANCGANPCSGGTP